MGESRRSKTWKRQNQELSEASEELGSEVLSAGGFQTFVERERGLAERQGLRFAVISLKLDPGTPQIQKVALGAIGQRIRETDLVGWGDKGELRVLLRHVRPEAALRIAQRLSSDISDHATTVDSVVYPFPPALAEKPKAKPEA